MNQYLNRFLKPGLIGSILLYSLFPFSNVFGIQILKKSSNAVQIEQYRKYELTFSLDTTYSNPFDPEIIDIQAVISLPDSSQIHVPAFYYREYEVSGFAPERYRNPGIEGWKIRYAPSRIGIHTLDIFITDAQGTTHFTNVNSFECIQGNRPGFIQIDATDSTCLRYSNGSPRINIGHNVCWLPKELADCQSYFSQMSLAGENWTRVWMCPWGNDGWVILEWTKDHWSGNFSGAGQYSMQTAQRIDSLIELAENYGIGLQLVLLYHGAFSTTTNANWADNPYNANRPDDGGFLPNAEDFFTDTQARNLTRNKCRYIVARWGYSPAILAWELFNEVQFTDGWRLNPSSVINWHREMSDYIRAIDPHRHLITTSSHASGFENIWNLPNIDLVQIHHYGTPVIGPFRSAAHDMAALYQKPVIIGEYGAGSVNGLNSETNLPDLPEPYQSQLLDGLVIHNGIWSSFHANSSAHLWWWDSYIEPYQLYHAFAPLHQYVQNEDLSNMHPAERVVSGLAPISAIPQVWDFSYIPVQTLFTLQNGSFPDMDKLPQYLQGSWHNAYRSDPTFILTLPQSGQLLIHVQEVSSYSEGKIRVLVNAQETFNATYPAGHNNFTISVPLPAGPLNVQIVNNGRDWFKINAYEFKSGNNPLDSIGLIKDDRALIWIYDTMSQYGKIPCGVFTDELITIRGLNDGRYQADFYDTRNTGGIIASQTTQSTNGLLNCIAPAFERDIALKIYPVCIGDLSDLIELTNQWLTEGTGSTADYNNDHHVNLKDYSRLSQSWHYACP